jgi:NitT/TauT family transport system ATP-binding protein
LAGLERATTGSVTVNGEPITKPMQECSMVFQSYTSFPWLTVLENIEFGLKYIINNSKERRERAQHFSKLVGLEDFEDSYISNLSGGMKQRVAIASALATDPEILFMDEPFGALDSQTRMMMQEHLLQIVEGTDKTVIFVTHDIEEALLLGDRIYVCSARPAKILAEFDVTFPHPRTTQTRNRKDFFNMKYQIFNLLRDHIYDEKLKGIYAKRKKKNILR